MRIKAFLTLLPLICASAYQADVASARSDPGVYRVVRANALWVLPIKGGALANVLIVQLEHEEGSFPSGESTEALFGRARCSGDEGEIVCDVDSIKFFEARSASFTYDPVTGAARLEARVKRSLQVVDWTTLQPSTSQNPGVGDAANPYLDLVVWSEAEASGKVLGRYVKQEMSQASIGAGLVARSDS